VILVTLGQAKAQLTSPQSREGVAMENFGRRTVLILAAGFLIANFSWFLALKEMRHGPTHQCAYDGPNVICTASH
jgi:hypothetical protein